MLPRVAAHCSCCMEESLVHQILWDIGSQHFCLEHRALLMYWIHLVQSFLVLDLESQYVAHRSSVSESHYTAQRFFVSETSMWASVWSTFWDMKYLVEVPKRNTRFCLGEPVRSHALGIAPSFSRPSTHNKVPSCGWAEYIAMRSFSQCALQDRALPSRESRFLWIAFGRLLEKTFF